MRKIYKKSYNTFMCYIGAEKIRTIIVSVVPGGTYIREFSYGVDFDLPDTKFTTEKQFNSALNRAVKRLTQLNKK